jgi:serralysin
MARRFTPESVVSPRLWAELLETRETPSISGAAELQTLPPWSSAVTAANAPPAQVRNPLLEQPRGRYAVGTGGGGTAQVNVYDAKTGAMLGIINPFGRGYTGGVSVATGDVTADGVEDIVVGSGRGMASTVKVFDGRTLKEVASFNGLASTFTGGMTIAVGDVTGDGRADIVVGAGLGSMSQVKVYSGSALFNPGKQVVASPVAVQNFIAFDKAYRGGISVSVADLNNDGKGDIVVSQGPGAGGVKVFDGKTNATMMDLKPFGTTFDLGVSVATGDVNGDGKADLVVGAMRGSPMVKVISSKGVELASYKAFDGNTGTRVAVQDINGDGKAEVIVSVGSGKPNVRILNGISGTVLRQFPAMMPHFNSGLVVG